MTDILERRASGIEKWDSQFYMALGDPATEPVDMRKQFCAGIDTLLDPLKKPNLDIKKFEPKRFP